MSALIQRGASWCLFVDGENFTKRGQAVLKAAGVANPTTDRWRRDVFLWVPQHEATRSILGNWWREGTGPQRATRAYFYTSMNTGEPEWTDTRLALRALGFEPRLFPRRQGRSKAVDIALTTDVLTLAYEDAYEVAVLFAGDGDYVPLVEAVKRSGRHVVVAFFSTDGLSPDLRIAADEFVDLSELVPRLWRERHEQDAEEAKALAGQARFQEALAAEAAERARGAGPPEG